MMMTLRRISHAALLAAGLALQTAAASAEDPSVAVRLSSMEEQMRQLFGQIEQLNLKIEQITAELQEMRSADTARAKPDKAAAATMGTQPDAGAQELAAQPPPPNGVERIEENDDLYAYQTGELDREAGAEVITGGLEQAPGPKPLGTLPAKSSDDGVPVVGEPADVGQPVIPEKVETASLEPTAPVAETPEKLYELSYESLLRRRYGEAEAGFRSFIEKNPEHELAGNAEFWLGETYYVQSNYKAAAQAFLTGYQTYPTNRKAPDSLLKLGMSLQQLGQKEQACAAFGTIDAKFPKAAETRKRAQNESQKAGC
jgi:tol-pal system protein YbgF